MNYTPALWARSFALFNPHAWVAYEGSYQGNSEDGEPAEIYKGPSGGNSYQGNNDVQKEVKTYKPTVAFPGWRKFLPTDLTSAHWYGPMALKRLVFSHIKHARGGGRDLPLGEFVRQFRGLSSTAKAKSVTTGFGDIKYLSDFEGRPDRVGDLLAAMQAAAKAPSHNVLGVVGEEHFRTHFEAAYDVKEFVYKQAKGRFASGLPFVFEFALATLPAPGDLYFGINFSSSFGDPLVGTRLVGPKFTAEGIRGFLRDSYALPDSGDSYHGYRAPASVAVAVHIVTPAPVFMDRGKSRLQLEEV
jgi:hypothetical protein